MDGTTENAPIAKARKKLPPFLDHFNNRDLKVLFRCSVAAWVASLLIFIGPSMREIGTATFFATLVIFMVPPTGIVFIFILGALTLIVGMAFGWTWGVIAMKAAQAARPSAETQASLQALGELASKQANATGQSVAVVEQELIYNGFMLDARVTAVYFCIICFVIYMLARFRATNPKFTLFQIFGTIIMDIFLTIGPLLPSFNGTIPKILVVPAAIGIGIGLACQILLFPKSTSHTVLEGMESLSRLLKGPLDVTVASLIENEQLVMKDLVDLKMKIIATHKSIEPALGFLQLDFSVSRWNADDVKSLREPLRQASLSSLSLLELQISRLGGDEKLEKLRALTAPSEDPPSGEADEKKETKKPREVGMRQLLESNRVVAAFRSPENEPIRQEVLDAIRQPCKKVLPVCQDASEIVTECIHAVNSGRWFSKPSKQHMEELLERSQSALETLQELRSAYAAETTERLIQTNRDLFDEEGKLNDSGDATMHRVTGIALGMVFEEHVLGVIDSWKQVLGQLSALMRERQNTRLWLPRGLRYAFNWVFGKTAVAPVIAAQSPGFDPDLVEQQSKAAQLSLSISRGYGVKQRSGLEGVILGSYHWLINAQGLYALRLVVVTIALAIPAVIPSSAGFYYREKGLWALIMGQTTLVVYMPDFTMSLFSRAIGTIVGGVMGLVAWYIGSGHGSGNSFGLSAIMAPMIVILMWGRIFFPPALLQGTIMGGATLILVVGYSFTDTHNPTYGNPGFGYSVFWRRLLLVIVGSGAALIVQLFPRPPSASRHICKSLSNTIRSLSDYYALLLSCWGQPDRDEGLLAEQLAFQVAESLAALDGPVAMLRLEFSSSPFDSESLVQVKSLCQKLNQHLGRLLYLSASLPEKFQSVFTRRIGLLDHRQIGDVMAVLGVVEQALKTEDPLPEVLPTPLLKRCLEYRQAHRIEIQLTIDLMRDEDYRKFCVAISSYLKFLATVDDLVLVMKGSLGEAHIVNRELMQELLV
ncbi:hypothetical protein N7495_001004 [Penicillium taxi]|uniref:uncharacterized protein n=1 Tax=Penicillium taxi TaxID=168475 RepID=UPI0025459E11|nr:uncharacterized protein N7495_001004 [Penicillium taxi]KAJ5908322.1 hypothetical protein N7495_001004 [Penicillium taxi]